MVVRLTIKTTPGRPIVAALIMTGLLALAALAAWMVTQFKSNQPIALGPPNALGDLPLTISVPADWGPVKGERPRPGRVAIFAEPGSGAAGLSSARRLEIYFVRLELPVAPTTLVRELYQESLGTVSLSGPLSVGPLPARQTLVVTHDGHDLQKDLVRMAVIGAGQYLVLRLVCLGPPTPYEVRLMDKISESVQADPDVYVPPDRLESHQLDGQHTISVTAGSGSWLVRLASDQDRGLVLLPSAQPDGKPAMFWGLVAVDELVVKPQDSLSDKLTERVAGTSAPSGPLGVLEFLKRGLVRGNRVAPPAGAKKDTVGPVEERPVGALTVCRVRSVRVAEKDVVRLRYLFRPLGGSDRAVFLDASTASQDEPAAVAAIEQLIGSIRAP